MESNDLVNIDDDIKKKIFPAWKGVDRSKLLITNVGMYSVSKIRGALELVKIIRQYFKGDVTITDATANVGSDSIMLALNFKNINSIEMSRDQYLVLKHNVNEYKLNNITLFNGDSLQVLKEITQDVIYIDAPWGGTDYKDHEKISLFLSNKELSEIYNEYSNKCKLMIFKVPRNYDFTYFMQHTNAHDIRIIDYKKFERIIYYFIVIWIK